MTALPAEACIELPDGLVWHGLDRPLRLVDERGRTVVIWVWSAGDVHSLEGLAILEWLAIRHAGRPLRVVTVHTARITAERGVESVAEALRACDCTLPAAIDDDGAAFRALGATRWPTLVVIDGEGRRRFRGAGVPDRDRLAMAVGALLDACAAPQPPLPGFAWQRDLPRLPTGLRAPTGLAVDPARKLLWVADTGRHRVLALDPTDGELRHVVGTGRPGAADGDPSIASFCLPRGLACVEDGRVLVCDSGNHLVRVIDLDSAGVTTLLGIGRSVRDPVGGRLGPLQGITAPFGLAVSRLDAYLALAGGHQLWSVAVDSGHAEAWAGTGQPGAVDGLRHEATLMQPRAVVWFGARELLFVDGLTGSLRCVDLDSGVVHTVLAGTEPDAPRLPAALAVIGDAVLIADELGDRVLRVTIGDGTVSEVLGLDLRRPSGVAVLGDTMFVSDRGRDRIVAVDLTSGATRVLTPIDPYHSHPPVEPATVHLRARTTVTFCFPLPIPYGERIDPAASGHAWVRAAGGTPIGDHDGPIETQGTWGMLRDVPTFDRGTGAIEVLVRYATCADLGDAPHLQEVRVRLPVEVGEHGAETVDVPVE